MLPVRVEVTPGKEVIPAVTRWCKSYPLQRVFEAQRAEGEMNKQLSMWTRLPADISATNPVEGLQFEVPEAEYASPAMTEPSARAEGV